MSKISDIFKVLKYHYFKASLSLTSLKRMSKNIEALLRLY